MDIYGNNGTEITETPPVEETKDYYGYAIDDKTASPLLVDISSNPIIQFFTETTAKTEENTILSVNGLNAPVEGLYHITAAVKFRSTLVQNLDIKFTLTNFITTQVYTEYEEYITTSQKKTAVLSTIIYLTQGNIICIRATGSTSITLHRHELSLVKI